MLEDDYDSEYRYVSRPLASLQGMDPRGRVIYIGSFSKVLFPSLRVGYLVVPPSLRERFVEARESFDIFSPTLYQLALADFLREGHFARHLRRMRTVYARRRDALLAGLAEHCAGTLAVLNADAGLHISTRLPPGVDDVATIARLRATRTDGQSSVAVLRRGTVLHRIAPGFRRVRRAAAEGGRRGPGGGAAPAPLEWSCLRPVKWRWSRRWRSPSLVP